MLKWDFNLQAKHDPHNKWHMNYLTALEQLSQTVCLLYVWYSDMLQARKWHMQVTYKSSTVVTEGRFQVCCLLEIMEKSLNWLWGDGTGPHEIGCNFVPAY